MDREAELADDAVGAGPPREGNWVAEPTSPEPASAEVTTAKVSREAKVTLNLFKGGTK